MDLEQAYSRATVGLNDFERSRLDQVYDRFLPALAECIKKNPANICTINTFILMIRHFFDIDSMKLLKVNESIDWEVFMGDVIEIVYMNANSNTNKLVEIVDNKFRKMEI